MKNIKEQKQKFLRWFYGTICLGTVAFVFQACYGMDRDYGYDVRIQGIVKSKTTGQPIKGIKVSIENIFQYDLTDDEGQFTTYVPMNSAYKLKFEDIDSIDNGEFIPKDTVLTNITDKSIFLNISLDEK